MEETSLLYQTAQEIARQAGNLLAECFNHTGTLAFQKADHTLVTEADLAADRLIHESLAMQFPQHKVLSEETKFQELSLPGSLWVVDPLDGTTNFSNGLHYWGVSIAYLQNGIPQVAALNFPLLGEMYTAEKGKGAWRNGQPIHVRPPTRTSNASFFSCCPRTFRAYDVSVKYKTRILGSTAYSLCCVGRGAAVGSFDAAARVWDVAGGWLVVEEAGGCISTFQREMLFPPANFQDFVDTSYPVISAAECDLLAVFQNQLHNKVKAKWATVK